MKLIPLLTLLLVFTASLLGADIVRLVGDPVLKGNVTDYSMSDGSKLTLKRLNDLEGRQYDVVQRYQVDLSNSAKYGSVVLLNIDGNPLISAHRRFSISFSGIESAMIDDDAMAILLASPTTKYLFRKRLEPTSENKLEFYQVIPRIDSFDDEQIFELIDLFTIRQTVRDLSKQTLRVHHYFVREDGVQWLDGVLHQNCRRAWMSFQRQADGTMILDDPYPDGKLAVGIVTDNEPMKPLLLYAAKTTAPKSADKHANSGAPSPEPSGESQSTWLWVLIGSTLVIIWLLSRKNQQ